MNGDYEKHSCGCSPARETVSYSTPRCPPGDAEELASPNPNTAVFREFAVVDVRLHPRRVPLGVGPGPEVEAAEVSAADTIDPEGAPTRAAEVELEAEWELKAAEEIPPIAAEVGGVGPADATAATRTAPNR